ncbi:hypothetical protein Q8A67_014481 [Cirrhinus molitorella]|uniref:Immunoglobulin V-set domain-containing protein n=1 Tax=Cirrhinus molitorella TaxID=172907 RepID=A0AA88TL13_9TELE|nr:hypothetical protein Q8A67_014481 [Cirrhinus molitorella]
MQVATLIGANGNEMIIQCTTDKTPQDGVYMYKQEEASKNEQKVFYYYKDGTFKPKSEWCRDKVKVNGTFPNLNVTILNVNATDIGHYWCEFNWEDKITLGTVTWLRIESVDKKTNNTGEVERTGKAEGQDYQKVCPEDSHLMILVMCAVMSLLCIIGFIFVILKVKGCWGNKKYSPSNPPSDSVYEEMKRSNLDVHPSVRTIINPDYQTIKLLR